MPELIRIPAGEFWMGSEEDKVVSYDEKPNHRISLEEFWIGCYPLTNEEYQLILDDDFSCQAPPHFSFRQ